jgi:small subunit ribosomal protein S5
VNAIAIVGSGAKALCRSVDAPRSSREGRGQVAWGYGKANEVPPAVEKGVKDAHKQMKRVQLRGGTIPHMVIGHFGAAKVLLLPASPGTGVIAGGAVRAVVEAAGVRDILTKSFGSTNKLNLVKAALDALTQLRTKDEIARLRGVQL